MTTTRTTTPRTTKEDQMNRHLRNIRRTATTRARDVWRWPDVSTTFDWAELRNGVLERYVAGGLIQPDATEPATGRTGAALSPTNGAGLVPAEGRGDFDCCTRLDPEWYDGMPEPLVQWVRGAIHDGVLTEGAWTDGALYGISVASDIYADHRDRDIAEAVAHEREAIAGWVNIQGVARLNVSRKPGVGANVSALIHEAGVALNSAAAAIRSGAHNAGVDRG